LKLFYPAAPLANGELQCYFTAMSNKTYSVEYRESLTVGEWLTLASFDSLPTNRVIWVTDSVPPGAPKRFYRVKTPMNPSDQLGVLRLDMLGLANGAARLSFVAKANHSYSIEEKTALGAPAWATLRSYDAQSLDRIIQVTNSLPPGQMTHFYRLRTPRNE